MVGIEGSIYLVWSELLDLDRDRETGAFIGVSFLAAL
jgi:hypothetical protein